MFGVCVCVWAVRTQDKASLRRLGKEARMSVDVGGL